MKLSEDDFNRINFHVWFADIDGGMFAGGTTVTINLQNSHKVFINGPDVKFEKSISSFREGLEIANMELRQTEEEGDDEPCYWQREEWVKWIVEIATRARDEA